VYGAGLGMLLVVEMRDRYEELIILIYITWRGSLPLQRYSHSLLTHGFGT